MYDYFHLLTPSFQVSSGICINFSRTKALKGTTNHDCLALWGDL